MATIEKIDKIEKIHDDISSSKNSEQTTTARDSETTSDYGKQCEELK